MKDFLIYFFLYIAIRCIQKVHKMMPSSTDHRTMEVLCMCIQHLDVIRTEGKSYSYPKF